MFWAPANGEKIANVKRSAGQRIGSDTLRVGNEVPESGTVVSSRYNSLTSMLPLIPALILLILGGSGTLAGGLPNGGLSEELRLMLLLPEAPDRDGADARIAKILESSASRAVLGALLAQAIVESTPHDLLTADRHLVVQPKLTAFLPDLGKESLGYSRAHPCRAGPLMV